MLIQDRLYHILYKTECTPTKEFYYGIHSTNNLKDGYIGSGKKLLRKIKKYGKGAFSCSIISCYKTRKEAALAEQALVTKELLKDPLCLNLQTGGFVNLFFSAETLAKMKKTPEQRRKISERRKGKATFVTPEQRKAHSLKVSGDKNGMSGVKRPIEWCQDQSARQKALFAKGDHPFVNSRGDATGRAWYHNPITKESLMLLTDNPPPGFVRGRGPTGNNLGKPHIRKLKRTIK